MGRSHLFEKFNIENIKDLDILQEWAKDVKVPKDSLLQCAITSEGVLCGAGFVEIIGEATIVLNPALPLIDKSEVIRHLFAKGREESLKENINKWVVFTDNKIYAQFLKKRFGFTDSSGIGLQLEL
jgi:hypothetical protein